MKFTHLIPILGLFLTAVGHGGTPNLEQIKKVEQNSAIFSVPFRSSIGGPGQESFDSDEITDRQTIYKIVEEATDFCQPSLFSLGSVKAALAMNMTVTSVDISLASQRGRLLSFIFTDPSGKINGQRVQIKCTLDAQLKRQ